VARYIRSNSKF